MSRPEGESRQVMRFAHPDEIRYGQGRVLYDPTLPANSLPGWVLPGGLRTSSRELATTVAMNLNKLIEGRQP